MRFVFVPHALQRMKQRGIPITDLKKIIKNDGKTKTSISVKIRNVSQGRAKNGRILEVVYDLPPKKAQIIIVITAYYL